MTAQQPVEIKSASPLDSVLLALAVAALIGGMVAFYFFEGQFPAAVRVLMVLAGFGVAAGLAYQTQSGRTLWGYIRGANIELRKTTWPSRQESLQATLMIAVVVLITSVLLWLLDMGLLSVVKRVTGQV